MLDSIILNSGTGDNALFVSDLILDFSFVRPMLVGLLALFETEVDVWGLITAIFFGGSTGVSLNGTLARLELDAECRSLIVKSIEELYLN